MIKNIIFDLGGVLMDIDFSKTKKAFDDLGFSNFDELFHQFHSSPLFVDLEIGTISDEDFLDQLQQHAPQPVSHRQMIDAWNALIGDFRMDDVTFVNELRSTHNIYLLSNTNSIHYKVFQEIYTKQTGKNFDDNFHFAHYSHILGKRKPLTETYKAVLDIHSMNAAETLFIDDSYNNIEGAAAAGLHTHLLLSGEKVSEVVPSVIRI